MNVCAGRLFKEFTLSQQHDKADNQAYEGRDNQNKKDDSGDFKGLLGGFPEVIGQEKQGIYAYQGGDNVIEDKPPEFKIKKTTGKKKGVPDPEGDKTAGDKGKNTVFVQVIVHFFQGLLWNHPGKNIYF